MAIDLDNWLKSASEKNDPSVLVDELMAEKSINPVYAYEEAQKLAIDFRDNKGGIPDELVKAIQTLANRDSGFTGLTIHEAWIGMNRKK